MAASLATPLASATTHLASRAWLPKAGILALCAGLAACDGTQLVQRLSTITPLMAYAATDVRTVTSPASGRLSFAAAPGEVTDGEPVIGIENIHGKTILIDAAGDSRVVSQDRLVGQRVKRGDALLAVSARTPAVYLIAIVTRDQAFQLASGTDVQYRLLGVDAAETIIHVPADKLERTMLPAAPGEGAPQLYQVRFRIADGATLTRSAPVSLLFRQDLRERLASGLDTLLGRTHGAPIP